MTYAPTPVDTAVLNFVAVALCNEEGAARYNICTEEARLWRSTFDETADFLVESFVPHTVDTKRLYATVCEQYGDRPYAAQEWQTASSYTESSTEDIPSDTQSLAEVQRQLLDKEEQIRVLRTALWQSQQRAYPTNGHPVHEPAEEAPHTESTSTGILGGMYAALVGAAGCASARAAEGSKPQRGK